MQVIDLPFSYKSGVVATWLANEPYRKFKPKELDDVKVMYPHAHGPALLHAKRPVSKLEDVKGMKIRTQGTVVPIVQVLGGAPVGTIMGETYDALRTDLQAGMRAGAEKTLLTSFGFLMSLDPGITDLHAGTRRGDE